MNNKINIHTLLHKNDITTETESPIFLINTSMSMYMVPTYFEYEVSRQSHEALHRYFNSLTINGTAKTIDVDNIPQALPDNAAALQKAIIEALEYQYSHYEQIDRVMPMLIVYFYSEILAFCKSPDKKENPTLNIQPNKKDITGLYINYDFINERVYAHMIFKVEEYKYLCIDVSDTAAIHVTDSGSFVFNLRQYGINKTPVEKIYENDDIGEYEAKEVIETLLGKDVSRINFCGYQRRPGLTH